MRTRVAVAAALGLLLLWGRGRSSAAAAEAGALRAHAVRTGLPAAAFRVRRTTPETWPDASLGLAPVGAVYPAAPVAGYRLELERVGGSLVAEYHCDAAGRCLYCPPCSARLLGAVG